MSAKRHRKNLDYEKDSHNYACNRYCCISKFSHARYCYGNIKHVCGYYNIKRNLKKKRYIASCFTDKFMRFVIRKHKREKPVEHQKQYAENRQSPHHIKQYSTAPSILIQICNDISRPHQHYKKHEQKIKNC